MGQGLVCTRPLEHCFLFEKSTQLFIPVSLRFGINSSGLGPTLADEDDENN
jgi:hypothetical protein